MASLALERAPAASGPLRFLRLAPAWGVLAAALLMQQGGAVFASRWSPATIALVHVFTLGVLGNAVLGSLLQFLPVAAEAPPRLGRVAAWLPVAYNLGALGLVAGLLRWPMLLLPAGGLLAGTLATFALGALAGLRFDGRQTPLHAGLALTLGMLLATALLGLCLVLGLTGRIVVPLPMLVDLHAALGLLGGVLLLAGSVGSVVLPMFQGTSAVPGWLLGAWIASIAVALAVGAGLRWAERPGAMAAVLALPLAAFAVGVLVLQWRAPHARNPTLGRAWRLGAFCLLLAAGCAGAAPFWPQPRLALVGGVLVIAIGLPALVLGMTLEIAAFLAWLELQGARTRRQRVPGVDALMPERRKAQLLACHAAAALALALAAAWPGDAGVRVAAVVLAVAHGGTLFELLELRRRVRAIALTLKQSVGVAA
jgi:hypothetical protein